MNRPEDRQRVEQYKRAQIETATPGQLVVMLYDGAIRFLQDSIEHIRHRRLDKANESIDRADNIILELMASLDRERGGEIAVNLARIYDFIRWHLVDANIKKDIGMIDQIVRMLSSLREAWAEAAKIVQQKQHKSETVTAGAVNLLG
ncbi:MAG: flagellar export chaperone FliS [bacterium]